MTDRATIVAALERHRDLFNAGERDAWLANLVDDPYLEEPVGSGRRQGRGHYAAVFDAVYAANPAASIPPFDDLIVAGSEVAVYLKGSPLPDGPPSGIVEIFEVAPDGRIAGARVFLDPRRLPEPP